MNVSELLCVLQNAMESLNGNDVRQKYAVGLIQEAASQLPEITPPLSIQDAKLWYDTPLFGKVPFIEFKPSFGKDSRTIDGLSYQIKQVDVLLTRDIPADLDISRLTRLLEYEAALERKQAALDNIAKLEAQIAEEKKIVCDMLAIIEQETEQK